MKIQINSYIITVTKFDVVVFCVIVSMEITGIVWFFIRRYRKKHGKSADNYDPPYPSSKTLPPLIKN